MVVFTEINVWAFHLATYAVAAVNVPIVALMSAQPRTEDKDFVTDSQSEMNGSSVTLWTDQRRRRASGQFCLLWTGDSAPIRST